MLWAHIRYRCSITFYITLSCPDLQFIPDKGWQQETNGFAFATYYNDHMVLQQAPQQAVIWGIYPDVGDRLIVKVNIVIWFYSQGGPN